MGYSFFSGNQVAGSLPAQAGAPSGRPIVPCLACTNSPLLEEPMMIATGQQARAALQIGHLDDARLLNRLGFSFAMAVSAILNLWNLAQNGYGNTYYAVAVQSMPQSWSNFF